MSKADEIYHFVELLELAHLNYRMARNSKKKANWQIEIDTNRADIRFLLESIPMWRSIEDQLPPKYLEDIVLWVPETKKRVVVNLKRTGVSSWEEYFECFQWDKAARWYPFPYSPDGHMEA